MVTFIVFLLISLTNFLGLYGAVMGRMAGGGLWAKRMRKWATDNLGEFWGSAAGRAPEAALTLPIGVTGGLVAFIGSTLFSIPIAGEWFFAWAVAAWIWSYFYFEMGHGTTQDMLGYIVIDGEADRIDGNEHIVRKLFPKVDRLTPRYSWLCMGYKGFMVTLPLGPFAVLGAILFPVGYWLGKCVEPDGNHGMAEMFGGLAVMLPTAILFIFSLMVIIVGAA